MFELAVHKPFYTKLNELLHLDNDEFYLSYHTDPVLAERMLSIEALLSGESKALTMAGFSIIEGAVLYSSFAFLKHFQSAGKNKLTNVVRGINFSVRDENIHSMAGAWAFKQYMSEWNPHVWVKKETEEKVRALCESVYNHEECIIDMVFEKGSIEGITPAQMKNFVQSRINVCLEQLGYGKMYEVKYNPIASYFYTGINGFAFNDQFSGISNSYHRNWDESSFVYKEYEHE
jgi:ribonucleotide reductase beta subunit family protein with ferritin-like domain